MQGRGTPSSGVSESDTRRPDMEARPGEYGGEYGMPPMAPMSRRCRCASAAFACVTQAHILVNLQHNVTHCKGVSLEFTGP